MKSLLQFLMYLKHINTTTLFILVKYAIIQNKLHSHPRGQSVHKSKKNLLKILIIFNFFQIPTTKNPAKNGSCNLCYSLQNYDKVNCCTLHFAKFLQKQK
jgi:hypothetical protein